MMKFTISNYSASERAALAVAFCVEKVWVRLLPTKPFNLRTDHQAFQYTFKTENIHCQLDTSLDFLPEHVLTNAYTARSSD